MTIARFEYYESCLDPHKYGDFVKFDDHIDAVEDLEYEIRTLNETITELKEDVQFWKEKYFEYYEQDQL